jgi:NADH:ubiquinone oxidoreductase subunit 3 (subunit A)
MAAQLPAKQFLFGRMGSIPITIFNFTKKLKIFNIMVYFEPLISLLIHIIISAGLCLVIITAVYLLNTPKPNSEKNISYECGFKPFDFAYYPFDIQFYRVGILFLLFDVEILYFFP